MSNKSRITRGREAQRIVARRFRKAGALRARAVGSFEGGVDVLNVPVNIEVKARRDFSPLGWLKQAKKHRGVGDHPVVFLQPDGYGEAKIDDWPVMLRVGDYLALLVKAGLLEGESHAAQLAEADASLDEFTDS